MPGEDRFGAKEPHEELAKRKEGACAASPNPIHGRSVNQSWLCSLLLGSGGLSEGPWLWSCRGQELNEHKDPRRMAFIVTQSILH